jgi:hypothetical protein
MACPVAGPVKWLREHLKGSGSANNSQYLSRQDRRPDSVGGGGFARGLVSITWHSPFGVGMTERRRVATERKKKGRCRGPLERLTQTKSRSRSFSSRAGMRQYGTTPARLFADRAQLAICHFCRLSALKRTRKYNFSVIPARAAFTPSSASKGGGARAVTACFLRWGTCI